MKKNLMDQLIEENPSLQPTFGLIIAILVVAFGEWLFGVADAVERVR